MSDLRSVSFESKTRVLLRLKTRPWIFGVRLEPSKTYEQSLRLAIRLSAFAVQRLIATMDS